MLLLLYSCDDVDHSLPIPGDPNFWPTVEMKLPNLSALVFLVEEESLRSISWCEIFTKKPTSSRLWGNHPRKAACGGGTFLWHGAGQDVGNGEQEGCWWWAQGQGRRRMRAAGWMDEEPSGGKESPEVGGKE